MGRKIGVEKGRKQGQKRVENGQEIRQKRVENKSRKGQKMDRKQGRKGRKGRNKVNACKIGFKTTHFHLKTYYKCGFLRNAPAILGQKRVEKVRKGVEIMQMHVKQATINRFWDENNLK